MKIFSVILLHILCKMTRASLMASDAQHIERESIERVDPSQCLEAVDKMTLKNFNYPFKEFQKSHFGNRREIGMLAQDAISVLPSD